MWIFAQNGFASVVEHRDDPACVLVRCRCADDATFFADRLGVEWFTDDLADYRYRMEAPKADVAQLVGELVPQITIEVTPEPVLTQINTMFSIPLYPV